MPVEGDHPKVAAMKEKMQQRLQQQEAHEQEAKEKLADSANAHLESFYQVCCGVVPCLTLPCTGGLPCKDRSA